MLWLEFSTYLLRQYEGERWKKKDFWGGAQAAIPTALGYVSIGLAWGDYRCALWRHLLRWAWWAYLFMLGVPSLPYCLDCGSSACGSHCHDGFLINLPSFLLSLHASTYFRHTSLWQNIGMSSLLTDETYGVLMANWPILQTRSIPMWMHGNNLNNYVAWFVGTVVGTALGGLLPNPEIFGLDFALVGMFIGILLRNSRLCKDGFLSTICSLS